MWWLYCRYANIPDEWEPPTPLPYKVQTDLHSFLLDNDAYDQFSVVCSSEMGMQVQIWQNSQPDPTELENRNVSSLQFYLQFIW